MLIAPDGRRLLSTTEAQERSGLSRDHLGLMVRRSQLEAVKIGNYWLIYEESLEHYLASPRKPGPKPKTSTDQSSTASMPEKMGNVG